MYVYSVCIIVYVKRKRNFIPVIEQNLAPITRIPVTCPMINLIREYTVKYLLHRTIICGSYTISIIIRANSIATYIMIAALKPRRSTDRGTSF